MLFLTFESLKSQVLSSFAVQFSSNWVTLSTGEEDYFWLLLCSQVSFVWRQTFSELVFVWFSIGVDSLFPFPAVILKKAIMFQIWTWQWKVETNFMLMHRQLLFHDGWEILLVDQCMSIPSENALKFYSSAGWWICILLGYCQKWGYWHHWTWVSKLQINCLLFLQFFLPKSHFIPTREIWLSYSNTLITWTSYSRLWNIQLRVWVSSERKDLENS